MEGISLTATPEGVLLDLKVSAGAAREALIGPYGGALKLSVRTAPERGRANRSVLRLLSSSLGLPRGAVEIRAGAASPRKTVLIRGATADDVRRALARALPEEQP